MSGDLNSAGSSQRSASFSEEQTHSLWETKALVFTEVFDEKSQPTEAEVLEYAHRLGIDTDREEHLLVLARQGLTEELPAHWKPCWDESAQDFFYFNFETRQTQWEHPLDGIYLEKVQQSRLLTDPRGRLTLAKTCPELLLDPDITEVSGDTSDILSIDAKRGDSREEDVSDMDSNAPRKLAPLPPLGKQLGPISVGRKSLPPVKTLGPPPGGGGIGKPPTSLHQRPSPINPGSKPLTRPVLGGLKVPKETLTPLSSPSKSLGMSGHGLALMKSPSFNAKERTDSSPENSSQISSASGPIKGILKSSAVPPKSVNNDRQLYRDSLAQADKKRIHFNERADVKELKLDLDSGSSEEGSFDQVPTKGATFPKPTPGIGILGSLSSSEESNSGGGGDDFMARHGLFDPEDLVLEEHGTVQDLVTVLRTDQRPCTAVDADFRTEKPKTKLSKILSSVSIPEHVEEKDPQQATERSEQNALNAVKLTEDTLANVKGIRDTLGRTSKDPIPQRRTFKEEAREITPTLVLKNDDNIPFKLNLEVQSEVKQFKERINVTLEQEKTKIEEQLRRIYQDEIAQIKDNLQMERQRQEDSLKNAFMYEMQKLRETMESNLEIQRSEMLSNFHDEMSKDSKKLDGERREQLRAQEMELQKTFESQLEHYRVLLKKEVDNQKQILESEFKERLLLDVERAKADILEDIRRTNQHQVMAPPVETRESPVKDDVRASFVQEIRSLEDTIRELKTQLQGTAKQAEHPISGMHNLKDNDTSDEEDNLAAPIPRHPKQAGQTAHYRSRASPQPESDADSLYESSQMDLNKSLQNLQRRVNCLEKSLNPFYTAYQGSRVVQYNMASPSIGHYAPMMPNQFTLPSSTSARITSSTHGWTVDEQIYKSKLWLKQRNQTRHPK